MRRSSIGKEIVAMLPVKNNLTFAYALSGLLAILLLVSSVVGLLYGGRGLYDSYPASLAGLVGQDAVTLVVGLPLLAVSTWLTSRGSTRGLLLWTGTLFYFAYSYYFYVVGGFNALFLIYIAIVSTSLYGLLSALFALDPEALRVRFGAGAPTHLVGGFLIGISLLFVFMWGGMVLSSAAAGTRPEEVLREVVIIDCTVLLPLLFFGGLRLWRREPWGYVLGGLLLVKALATGSTLAFTTALGAWWIGTIDPFLFILFALMAVGALLLIVPYLRSVDERGGRKTGSLP
jgi:hypothetical protein